MIDVLATIYRVLFWITEVYVLYYVLLDIVGLFCYKQKYPMVEDEKKFCIFVPCHNEGPVVAATVRNYSKLNYDKKLYNIYFIADNCSDGTANILRETIEECKCENFYVLERNVNDPNKRGKPHALRWGIEQLEAKDEFYSKYDFFMIFDADNFADADILKHMNSQYLSYPDKKKPVMIQAYLDSKNKEGLVARGNFTTYRVMNGFWQISKQKLHLVPGIGGTGFAITTEYLKSIGGFNCNSLTEDLEIQTKATIQGKRIVYNRNVRIYDEKPTKVKQSIVQRTRWAQGHWYLAFKYLPILFIQLFNPKKLNYTFKKLDVMMYLLSRFCILCMTISFPLWIFFLFYNRTVVSLPYPFDIIALVLMPLSLLVIPLSSLRDGTPEEKKRVVIDFIPNLLGMYLIFLMDVVAGVIGLFKCGNQKVWKKTAHQVTQMPSPSIEQVGSEIKAEDVNKDTK